MALFEQTLKSMSPFGTYGTTQRHDPSAAEGREDDLDDLRAQMAAMQEKLDKMG
jgi:polyhydroxyalkanoate synthesis regulator protein